MNTRIYSTDKGQVIRRIPDNDIIIEFGNLSWKLSILQLKMLKSFAKNIDGSYFKKINQNSFYRRKVRIPIHGTTLSILLSTDELEDFKALLSGIPANALEKEDIYNILYHITENHYDRPDEPTDEIHLIHPSFKYFLN
ncbi:MAG: hypothetical protein PF590_05275 [Candidatus Delongbacteria bacterium]|jgi:hypothetical protein|nr:hypothetical protein [Candidatus Delongbacteria bacterium]